MGHAVPRFLSPQGARIMMTENLRQQRHCRAFFDLVIPDNSVDLTKIIRTTIEDLIIF
jgi:hypothetical protein